MQSPISPEPLFDVLAVPHRLGGQNRVRARSVSRGEIHLFAYVGCLMSLYDRRPLADWGYRFIRVESGDEASGRPSSALPFSLDLDDAIEWACGHGLLDAGSSRELRLSRIGDNVLRQLESMERFVARARAIRAACDSAISIEPGNIRLALRSEPAFQVAARRNVPMHLGDDGAEQALYEQFAMLKRTVGVETGLLLPAMIWISALAAASQDHDASPVTSRPK